MNLTRTAPMRRLLFVGTGNIFRSLTAEYALRDLLGNPVVFESLPPEPKTFPTL